jgi:glycerophosphoryl diester phosphodiesterase
LSNLIRETVTALKRRWKRVLATDIVFQILSLVVLTPIVAAVFRGFVACFHDGVLADEDLLLFFISPAGLCCFVVVAALWLAIRVLELATLMMVIGAPIESPIRTIDALGFTWRNAPRISRIAFRVVCIFVLTFGPLLALAFFIYKSLLSDHDINYYLAQRPPEFWTAAAAGLFLSGIALLVGLYFLTKWVFAVPILLLEQQNPTAAMRTSGERVTGDRTAVVMAHITWFIAVTVISSLATSTVLVIARFAIPLAGDSMWLLVLYTGMSLLLSTALTTTINLLSTASLASLHWQLYRQLGGGEHVQCVVANNSDATKTFSFLNFRLTRNRVLAASVVGIVITLLVGAVTVRSVGVADDVELIAHRGSSFAAPENTFAAFDLAVAEGADWIELDVQLTADGEVVVIHDRDLMRVAKEPIKVGAAALDDLENIDIGTWFDEKFSNQRIATLGEVLNRCRNRIKVNIELKYSSADGALETAVAKIVDATGMSSQIVVMSLDQAAVNRMKRLRPNWRVGLLMTVSATKIERIPADFLAVNAAFASRSFILSAHQRDKQVYVWTVNDTATMSTMISRGVDGLITDKPALARSVLQQRASLSPPERLLLELSYLLGGTPEPAGH